MWLLANKLFQTLLLSVVYLLGLFWTQLRYEATELPDGFKMLRRGFYTEEISIIQYIPRAILQKQ